MWLIHLIILIGTVTEKAFIYEWTEIYLIQKAVLR